MSQETATLDQELELEAKKISGQAAQLRRAHEARRGSMRTVPAAAPRNFRERLKDMFSNLAKALEGDRESHKFRS